MLFSCCSVALTPFRVQLLGCHLGFPLLFSLAGLLFGYPLLLLVALRVPCCCALVPFILIAYLRTRHTWKPHRIFVVKHVSAKTPMLNRMNLAKWAQVQDWSLKAQVCSSTGKAMEGSNVEKFEEAMSLNDLALGATIAWDDVTDFLDGHPSLLMALEISHDEVQQATSILRKVLDKAHDRKLDFKRVLLNIERNGSGSSQPGPRELDGQSLLPSGQSRPLSSEDEAAHAQ